MKKNHNWKLINNRNITISERSIYRGKLKKELLKLINPILVVGKSYSSIDKYWSFIMIEHIIEEVEKHEKLKEV